MKEKVKRIFVYVLISICLLFLGFLVTKIGLFSSGQIIMPIATSLNFNFFSLFVAVFVVLSFGIVIKKKEKKEDE